MVERIHLGPHLLDLHSELMHSSQDYVSLQLSRMEKWLLFSHLCSADLSFLTSLQVRSPGDLIWRWALHCEHATQQPGRAQLHGPTFASHLILKPCLPTWLGTFLPQTASDSVFRLREAEKHALLPGSELSCCQAFLARPAPTSVVRFQEHWDFPVCTQTDLASYRPKWPIMRPELTPFYKCIPLT